ncbi:unnamed protein product [Lampetra fluviatilis]
MKQEEAEALKVEAARLEELLLLLLPQKGHEATLLDAEGCQPHVDTIPLAWERRTAQGEFAMPGKEMHQLFRQVSIPAGHDRTSPSCVSLLDMDGTVVNLCEKAERELRLGAQSQLPNVPGLCMFNIYSRKPRRSGALACAVWQKHEHHGALLLARTELATYHASHRHCDSEHDTHIVPPEASPKRRAGAGTSHGVALGLDWPFIQREEKEPVVSHERHKDPKVQSCGLGTARSGTHRLCRAELTVEQLEATCGRSWKWSNSCLMEAEDDARQLADTTSAEASTLRE